MVTSARSPALMPAPARFDRRRREAAGALLLVSLFAAGCVGGRLVFLPAAPPADRPWEIPPEAYPSQRLYRVEYEDAEDQAAFRLTLYLERPDRFRLQAVADLGRRVWTVDLEGGRATWIDHRRKEVCATDGERLVGPVPVADLPVAALARLLLGVLPAEPAAPPEWSDTGLAYRDARGQLWNGGLERSPAVEGVPGPARLLWWTLLEGDQPVSWWKVEDGRAAFTDRRAGRRLRWSEVAREPLSPLSPLAVPRGFEAVGCGSR